MSWMADTVLGALSSAAAGSTAAVLRSPGAASAWSLLYSDAASSALPFLDARGGTFSTVSTDSVAAVLRPAAVTSLTSAAACCAGTCRLLAAELATAAAAAAAASTAARVAAISASKAVTLLGFFRERSFFCLHKRWMVHAAEDSRNRVGGDVASTPRFPGAPAAGSLALTSVAAARVAAGASASVAAAVAGATALCCGTHDFGAAGSAAAADPDGAPVAARLPSTTSSREGSGTRALQRSVEVALAVEAAAGVSAAAAAGKRLSRLCPGVSCVPKRDMMLRRASLTRWATVSVESPEGGPAPACRSGGSSCFGGLARPRGRKLCRSHWAHALWIRKAAHSSCDWLARGRAVGAELDATRVAALLAAAGQPAAT